MRKGPFLRLAGALIGIDEIIHFVECRLRRTLNGEVGAVPSTVSVREEAVQLVSTNADVGWSVLASR
jgi:hypothetical protein